MKKLFILTFFFFLISNSYASSLLRDDTKILVEKDWENIKINTDNTKWLVCFIKNIKLKLYNNNTWSVILDQEWTILWKWFINLNWDVLIKFDYQYKYLNSKKHIINVLNETLNTKIFQYDIISVEKQCNYTITDSSILSGNQLKQIEDKKSILEVQNILSLYSYIWRDNFESYVQHISTYWWIDKEKSYDLLNRISLKIKQQKEFCKQQKNIKDYDSCIVFVSNIEKVYNYLDKLFTNKFWKINNNKIIKPKKRIIKK